jgi:AcrR family transcriptional regulator
MNSQVLDRAADAALELAADRPWSEITLRDIAERTGVSFAELYARTPSKSTLLERLSRRFDQAAVEFARDVEGDVHDRLFDTVMARLEAMEPFRFQLIAIARDEPGTSTAGRLPRTAKALLDAAGVGTSGWKGALRVAAMTAVWARVLQVWRDDVGALNRTMAELDKRLRQMNKRLGELGAGF